MPLVIAVKTGNNQVTMLLKETKPIPQEWLQEFEAAANTFGLSLDDFEKITINAMKSAFLPYDQRCRLIYSVIKPEYAKIRTQVSQKTGN